MRDEKIQISRYIELSHKQSLDTRSKNRISILHVALKCKVGKAKRLRYAASIIPYLGNLF